MSHDHLDAEDRKIVTLARAACRRAYVPHTGVAEGAAVRDTDGRTYAAATVEHTDPELTVSALRGAIVAAASSGARRFEAAAVVTSRAAASSDGTPPQDAEPGGGATALDPPTLGPATLGPATLGPATLGPATLGPATLGPATLDPATLDPATLDPATLDPATLDPATLDPATERDLAMLAEFGPGVPMLIADSDGSVNRILRTPERS